MIVTNTSLVAEGAPSTLQIITYEKQNSIFLSFYYKTCIQKISFFTLVQINKQYLQIAR